MNKTRSLQALKPNQTEPFLRFPEERELDSLSSFQVLLTYRNFLIPAGSGRRMPQISKECLLLQEIGPHLQDREALICLITFGYKTQHSREGLLQPNLGNLLKENGGERLEIIRSGRVMQKQSSSLDWYSNHKVFLIRTSHKHVLNCSDATLIWRQFSHLCLLYSTEVRDGVINFHGNRYRDPENT